MPSKVENASLLKKLPSYKTPPVNEVVCGMRFHPSDELRIPHIGLLWDKLRADYPVLQHAVPLSSTKGEMLVDRVTGLPLPRVWFISTSDDELVQFQNDRFYFNWRKKKSDYPHYGHVISKFETALSAIKDLFRDFDLGEFEPIEYELTYINHIPQGTGWKEISLRYFLTSFGARRAHVFYPYPKEVRWAANFPFPEQKGYLTASLKQGIRTEDESPVLVYELKAIGFEKDNVVRNWFDLAHEWIVRGFTDQTTHKMHEIWGIDENA